MPIYEYICQECGRKNEILVMNTEEIKCKYCSSNKMERVMSTFFSTSSGEKSSSPCSSCSPTPTKCSSCSLK